MVVSSIFLIVGLLALLKGADWLVDGASSLARKFGIAPIVIGLTVVAFGTSAPELIVNLVASMSGNTEIAIGNIVGSNIFNVFFILGVSAIIKPLPFSPENLSDVFVAIGATILLFLTLFVGKRHILERSQAAFFLLLYIAYLFFIIL